MATSKQTSTCSGASGVCLVEDDIPGAQLPRSTPEECSVTQLKRWLLCRAGSTTESNAPISVKPEGGGGGGSGIGWGF